MARGPWVGGGGFIFFIYRNTEYARSPHSVPRETTPNFLQSKTPNVHKIRGPSGVLPNNLCPPHDPPSLPGRPNAIWHVFLPHDGPAYTSLIPQLPTVDRNRFVPTPESIPPSNVSFRQNAPEAVPVHKHPLVRLFFRRLRHPLTVSRQNPLAFLLRGALIYPDHMAIAHPDVKHSAYYTYSVWFVLRSLFRALW